VAPRVRSAAHIVLILAGVALALILVLPIAEVRDRCPPPGEGYELCRVQKAWLPALLLVMAGAIGGHLVARTLLVRLPAWRARVRETGERRVGLQETREDPPYRSDPFLLASTWGAKHGRSDRRRLTFSWLWARLRRRG
jgi:hypothetical protein